MNVLLIHDDTLFSALVAEFLRFQGYVVSETNDAETTHVVLEHRRVDLAVCIVPADHSDKFTLLAEWHHHHSSLPLIVIATYPISAQMQMQLREHTPYLLTKPFTVASLLNMIGDATGVRKMRIRLSATSA
jgi:DNA-binding NtrC family response regulator